MNATLVPVHTTPEADLFIRRENLQTVLDQLVEQGTRAVPELVSFDLSSEIMVDEGGREVLMVHAVLADSSKTADDHFMAWKCDWMDEIPRCVAEIVWLLSEVAESHAR